MSKIIGTRYGELLGHMLGSLSDEFGLAEVEQACVTVIGLIRTLSSNPVELAVATEAVAKSHETIGAALRKANEEKPRH